MPQLLVRNLEREVILALKRQAVKRGRSMEAEHREFLRNHLLPPQAPKHSLKEVLASMPCFDDDLFDVR